MAGADIIRPRTSHDSARCRRPMADACCVCGGDQYQRGACSCRCLPWRYLQCERRRRSRQQRAKARRFELGSLGFQAEHNRVGVGHEFTAQPHHVARTARLRVRSLRRSGLGAASHERHCEQSDRDAEQQARMVRYRPFSIDGLFWRWMQGLRQGLHPFLLHAGA
jgi:hypothetical protein